MPRKKRNELTAGIFVILMLAVLIGLIIWIGGADLLRPAGQKAVFFVAEKTGSVGLEKGNFVQVGDDQVGKVSRIRFDPVSGKTFYYADIERDDFKIHADGEAKVAAALIGGARLVIVNRGSETNPLADENNPIELKGGLDKAMTDLGSAVETINKVIQQEFDVAQSGAVLAKIHHTVDSLKKAASDVSKIAANIKVETNRTDEKAMLSKVHVSLDDVNKMTADARPKIGETLTAVRDTAQQIRKYTREDVAEILAKLRESNTEILKIAKNFSAVSSQTKEIILLHRDNIDEIIDNMAQVSANLKAASKEIRRNPWRLLHKPDEKELHSQNIYDAARAFSNGAEQLDQAIAKMTGLAKASPVGIPPDDPALLKIRKQLEEVFGKFNKAEQALWKELNR